MDMKKYGKVISFDGSPRQVSKMRNGHSVRIKEGTGFNLVVHPNTYDIVNRAFAKSKGVQIQLSPEEIDANAELSPEQQDELGFMEGSGIFDKVKRAFHSKTAKKVGRILRPVTREAKKIAKEMMHDKVAEIHMAGADAYGDDDRMRRLMNVGADVAHEQIGTGLFDKVKKALHSKTAKKIGRILRPVTREAKKIGREMLHDKVAEMHMAGADEYGDNERMRRLMNIGADVAHEQIDYSGRGLGAGFHGRGLGAGITASYGYDNMNVHDALKMANMAVANANYKLAKMHSASVHGMQAQPPIRSYYNEDMAPPSRGSGMSNNYNMIRGRGSLLDTDDILPPALQSQPYGANFHMQFMLPPQYKKYNDGTDMEGRGLYL